MASAGVGMGTKFTACIPASPMAVAIACAISPRPSYSATKLPDWDAGRRQEKFITANDSSIGRSKRLQVFQFRERIDVDLQLREDRPPCRGVRWFRTSILRLVFQARSKRLRSHHSAHFSGLGIARVAGASTQPVGFGNSRIDRLASLSAPGRLGRRQLRVRDDF